MRRGILALLGLLAAGCVDDSQQQARITVLAAASLTDAVEALADSFEIAYPGYRVALSVASTSLLARQIEHGAPADVFFSANVAWMDHLEARGRLVGPARELFGNHLVVVGRSDMSTLSSIHDLAGAQRIAVADPEHVPAGVYAREGLECANLWKATESRLVPTIDVRAALLSAQTGAADVAIVYASDIRMVRAMRVLLFWPSDCAPNIRYAVASLRGGSNPHGAERLVAFATDPAQRGLWERYGFVPFP